MALKKFKKNMKRSAVLFMAAVMMTVSANPVLASDLYISEDVVSAAEEGYETEISADEVVTEAEEVSEAASDEAAEVSEAAITEAEEVSEAAITEAEEVSETSDTEAEEESEAADTETTEAEEAAEELVGASSNTFTFSDSAITEASSGSGYTISGTTLTITAAGTYTVTGSCSEGNIEVKKGVEDVTLILKNLTLSSSTTAPIVLKKTTVVTLDIEGTNTLTNLEDPANETSTDADVADAFEGAAIKAKSGANLTITGSGTLTADGSSCKNGIKAGSAATLTVGASTSDSFTLNVKAANNGIASDGELIVNGGTINVTSTGDGLKSAPEGDDADSAGTITINGGTITIDAEDGIQAAIPDADELVDGVTMQSTVGTLTINGGTFVITSTDDAVKADLNANILGGTFTISAADDGIKAEYVLNIGANGTTGPTINIKKATEGMEGATVNLYSGDGTIVTSDDGINAANSDLTNYSYSFNIYGGTWYINAGGDGLDSNGNLNVYGGDTTVFGSANSGNAALDIGDRSTFTYSAGTLAGIGMSGMAVVPTSGLYLYFGSSGNTGVPGGNFGGFGSNNSSSSGSFSVTKGDVITVKNSSGTVIYTATAVKSANSFLLCDDDLVSGSTYTLYINGKQASTASTKGTGDSASQGPDTTSDEDAPVPGQDTSSTSNGIFSDVQDPTHPYYKAIYWAAVNGITKGYSDGTFGINKACTRGHAVMFLWRMAGCPTPTYVSKTPFPDVPKTHAYYKAVLWAQQQGITKGYISGSKKGLFGIDDTCTRGQIMTFVWRFKGKPEPKAVSKSPFSDVPMNHAYYKAILWGYQKGVTYGYTSGSKKGQYGINDNCTRGQIVTFLYRIR